jgi:hypothetical protein
MEGTRTAEVLICLSIAEFLLWSSRNSSWRGVRAVFSRILTIFLWNLTRPVG